MSPEGSGKMSRRPPPASEATRRRAGRARSAAPAGGDALERAWQRRLEDVVETIQELAALRFDARAPVGPAGDIVDAVAAGVNVLGEELEAAFSEVERRVDDRTAELAIALQDLNRRALRDELTGLSNRTLFWDRLTQRLRVASRRPSSFAILYLDIDNFKGVNDRLGHAAGDQLLVDTAARLLTSKRIGDTAARLGGDEFAVLLDEVASADAAVAVGGRIVERLSAPYAIADEQLVAPASVGVALGPAEFDDADAMVAAADSAMYAAKRDGGRRCALYRPELHGRFERRIRATPDRT
jgi:diguanylate cyclase (GGDEF)-like protein